jgi:hypothetical protein
MNDDEFDLRVTVKLRSLWDELGVDEETRISQLNELRDSFRLLYFDLMDRLAVRCQDIRSEIERLRSTQRQAMKAFGLSDSEIQSAIPSVFNAESLLLQLEFSKQSYETFRALSADRIQKLGNLVCISKDLFDQLGISIDERGEFDELGDSDFSRDRVDRFKNKIQELRDEITHRFHESESLKSQISNLLTELQTPPTSEQQSLLQSKSVHKKTILELQTLFHSLETLKESRMTQLTHYAIEITHLWDLLEVEDVHRAEFLQSHSTIGEDDLEECRNEVIRLSAMKNERLPTLIQSQKVEAEDLWEKLHIAAESRPRFDSHLGDQSVSELVREFVFYEAEIVRLKKLTVAIHPLLNAIEEREEIVREYESVSQATTDVHRLLSREKGSAHQLMREEKARRRYKGALPKVEKKLVQLLTEFKNAHGTDFEWDGVPYIERLTMIQGVGGIQKSKSVCQISGSSSTKGSMLIGSPRKVINAENSTDQTIALRNRTIKP